MIVPGIPLRMSAGWVWLVWSWLVLAACWVAPRSAVSCSTTLAWAALAFVGMLLPSMRDISQALEWCGIGLSACLAAQVFAERGLGASLRRAVLAVAWCQVVICLAQAVGWWTPWPRSPKWVLNGTMGMGTPVAIWIAVAACWSSGWRRLVLALAACWIGSWTVISAMGLLLAWPVLRRFEALGLCLIGSAILGTTTWWRSALIDRLDVWRDWVWSWLGVGFAVFPGGFQDDTRLGRMLGWRDYHQTGLDLLARFGVLGLLALAVVLWWAWSHRKGQESALGMLCWAGCWQSLEQFPYLAVLLLVWAVRAISQHERGVDVAPA